MSTTTTTHTLLKHSAGLRKDLGAMGVGLNALGTYIATKISKEALDASKAVASNLVSVKWESGRVCIISKSNKGQVARFGRVSECGQFVEAVSQEGTEKGVVSVSIYGDSDNGEMRILSESELAKEIGSAEEVSYIRKIDGKQFTGKRIGSLADKYSSVIHSVGGKLFAIDVETKGNDYNAAVVGALGGKNTQMAKATASTLEKLAEGKVATAKVATTKSGRKARIKGGKASVVIDEKAATDKGIDSGENLAGENNED